MCMCVCVALRGDIYGLALIILVSCDRIVIKKKRNQQPKNGICPQNVSNNSPKNHIKMVFFSVYIVRYHITCFATQTMHEYIFDSFHDLKRFHTLFMESIINYCPQIKSPQCEIFCWFYTLFSCKFSFFFDTEFVAGF